MQPSAKDADWRPAVGDRVFAWFYTEWHTAKVRRLFEHEGEDKAEVLWETEFSTSELSMSWLAPMPGLKAAELPAGHTASADQIRVDMKVAGVAAPPGLASTGGAVASANLPPSMPPPPPPAPLSIASISSSYPAMQTAPTAPPASAPSTNQAAPAAPTAQAVRVATAATVPNTPARPATAVAAARKTKTDTSHSDPKEQPLRELREFCDHWGFEENTRRYLVGLPAKVQKVVINNFEAPPTVQCVDALVHNFAKSILLKHGYEDLDMDQFVARWSLDDETRRYLEGLPADLKCEVLYGFHPKDGKQDPGVQIRRFTQSIADKQGIVLPPSLRLGAGTATPSSVPLANAQSGTPQSSTTASSFSQRSPTALESKQTLQEELLVFIQSWQLSPVTAQAVKSLPANLQRQVLSGFSPKKGTRNVEALLHGYIKSISVTGGPEVKEPRASKEAAKGKAARKEAPKQSQPEPKDKRKEASTPGVAPPPAQQRPSPGTKSKLLGTGFAVLNESSSEPEEEEISPAPKQKAKATATAKPVPEPKKDLQQAPKPKEEKSKKKADTKPKDEEGEEKTKAQKEPKPGKAKEQKPETAPKDQADKAQQKAPEKGKNQKESKQQDSKQDQKQQDPKQQGKKPQDQKASSETEKAQTETATGTQNSKSQISQPSKATATANTKPAQPTAHAQQAQIPDAAPEPVFLVDERPSKKRKEPERGTQSQEWADFLMLDTSSKQAAESLVPTPAIATAALPTAMNFTTQKPELFSEATLPPPASEVTARTLEELEKKSAHLKELLTAGRDPDILAEKVDLQAESNSSSSKAKQKREKQKQKQLAKAVPDIRVQDLAPAGSQQPPAGVSQSDTSENSMRQFFPRGSRVDRLKCEPVTSSRMRVDSPHPRKDGLLLEDWDDEGDDDDEEGSESEDDRKAVEGEDVEEKRRLLRERSAQIVGRKRRNQKTRIVRRCDPDPAPS